MRGRPLGWSQERLYAFVKWARDSPPSKKMLIYWGKYMFSWGEMQMWGRARLDFPFPRELFILIRLKLN